MRTSQEIANAFSPREVLNGFHRFCLLGIGGAGMSALARMLHHRGFEVHGADANDGPEVHRLRREGINVSVGNCPVVQEGEAVILSDAINLESDVNVRAAKELGLPIFRRSQCLGWLLKDYKVIAVTGTHGKTTTTGLLGAGLIAAGVDPLVVVGASIPTWGGPVREGKGPYAVVEACEAYDSFHDIDPYVVLLTNLEMDHGDFHGTYENLRESVVRFVDNVPPDGALVFCADDRGASEVAELCSVRTLPYGLSEAAVRQLSNKLELGLSGKWDSMGLPQMALPGRHNQMNATGTLMVAGLLQGEGVSIVSDAFASGVFEFTGAERRLQVLREGDIVVVDDYAHHPTEVEASISALRARYIGNGEGRLIVVFQPHLYSRTRDNIDGFAKALSEADMVVLTDIYPAREEPIPGVSSARIAERLTKPVLYVPSRHRLPAEVAKVARPGDVVVGMGAGNIADFAPSLIRELERTGNSVMVLYGGDSAEREVSLHSGRAVYDALVRCGYNTSLVDFTEVLFGKADLSAFVGADRPDCVFLAVHGTHAEDGAMQGVLEMLGIPYTGSGIQTSSLAMDKGLTKKLLRDAGIRVPHGVHLRSPDEPVPFLGPWIVKPNSQGSTVGLSFVEKAEDLGRAIKNAFCYDSAVLVEEWIKGVEISTPVLCDRPLAPVEIAPVSGRYDFASKYTPGATTEIVPARLPEGVIKDAQRIALAAHKALGCAGATRTDAIVRAHDGHHEIYVLEVNTLPGMTKTSLLPNSAASVGINFDDLCRRLVEDALERSGAKA